MKLSENFSLSEFTVSAKAKVRGISNEPTAEVISNLTDLVQCVLQPLRTALELPFTITSGYRSPELNKAVGGSKTSQHNKGQAADFVVQGVDPLEICKILRDSDIDFDQLIYEQTWVHVSYAKGANRRQVLTATFKDGKASYSNGLPD
jgi:hypothetical protein